MNTRARAPMHRRAVRLKPRLWTYSAIIIGILTVILVTRGITRHAPYRQAMVIIGNPVRIVSFTQDRTRATLLSVPADTVIPALYGYGRYSIASLKSLDTIDKRGGALITQSISDAFGVPVLWYVEPDKVTDAVSELSFLKSLFRWSSIPRVFAGSIDTSMPFFTWVAFVLSVQSMAADSLETVQIAGAVVPVTMPDGVTSNQLDDSRFDFLLGQAIYDTALRGERLSVALYNSTGVPLVGLRSARLLTHMGIQLVFVGNSEEALVACRISGSKTALRSKTAAFIRQYYDCRNNTGQTISVGGGTGADIVVELGKSFAQRYE